MFSMMFGFAKYCKVIGQVGFGKFFTSFSIDYLVLVILASTAFISVYFSLKLALEGFFLGGLLSCFLFGGL